MELRSLLVPLDSSPLAEAALPYAEAIAKATNASLRLLTVAETAGEGVIGAGAGMLAYLPNSHREALSDYLADATAKVRERGFAVTMLMLEGRAAEAIALAAERLAADLIVMATHGRGGAARWLIGSVADKVMRTGTTPTLLVQPPEEGEPGEVSLRRIMVPLDGSPLAEGALPLAAQLALATGAMLILVHAEPFRPSLAGEVRVRTRLQLRGGQCLRPCPSVSAGCLPHAGRRAAGRGGGDTRPGGCRPGGFCT